MLLLDAYNILHTRGVLPPRLAGLEIPGLIHLIGRSRYAGRGLRLVCDGRRPATDKASAMRSGEDRVTLGPAEVWYAGEGKDADGLIERMLRTDSAARRMVVVSSDRRVQRAASRARAEFMGSEMFLMHLVRDEEAPRRSPLPEFVTAVPLDGYAVAHWIREFGVGEDWMGIRSSAPHPARGVPDGLAASAGRGVPAHDAARRAAVPAEDAARRAVVPAEDAARRAAVPKPELAADPPEWVREAMRLWGDRMRLDDLDMQKWLKP